MCMCLDDDDDEWWHKTASHTCLIHLQQFGETHPGICKIYRKYTSVRIKNTNTTRESFWFWLKTKLENKPWVYKSDFQFQALTSMLSQSFWMYHFSAHPSRLMLASHSTKSLALILSRWLVKSLVKVPSECLFRFRMLRCPFAVWHCHLKEGGEIFQMKFSPQSVNRSGLVSFKVATKSLCCILTLDLSCFCFCSDKNRV